MIGSISLATNGPKAALKAATASEVFILTPEASRFAFRVRHFLAASNGPGAEHPRRGGQPHLVFQHRTPSLPRLLWTRQSRYTNCHLPRFVLGSC